MLTILGKKNGSTRPIANGDIFVRLTGKIILTEITKDIIISLMPHALAIGIPGASEGASLVTTLINELLPILRANNIPLEYGTKENHIFTLAIDLKNCY